MNENSDYNSIDDILEYFSSPCIHLTSVESNYVGTPRQLLGVETNATVEEF